MTTFVCVRDFAQRFEAERAKSIVDAAEIVAVLLHDDAGGWWNAILPSAPRPQNRARLLVPEQDVPQARQVLADNGI